MEMTIRALRKDDVPSVVSLMLHNWDEVMPQHHSPGIVAEFKAKVTADGVKRQMERKRVFVVEHEGKVVGRSTLERFSTRCYKTTLLSSFAVSPIIMGGMNETHSAGYDCLCSVYSVQLRRPENVGRLQGGLREGGGQD